jgi:DNA-directed RNA polymerase subunit RPC12/RpoP
VPKFIARNDPFICGHCGKSVEPIKFGGSYRNHCPFCLYSRHVDGPVPGDRSNPCQGLMEPVGVTTKSQGEYTLVHRCTKCGFERLNRIAGDDNTDFLSQISGFPIK